MDSIRQEVKTLSGFFRLLIVFITWFVVSLVPDSSTGFYQGILVASFTALYEYVMIFIEAEDDKIKGVLSLIGVGGSALYALFAFFGFSDLVHLDLKNLTFTFSNKLPIPGITHFKASFYWVALLMYLFPGLIVLEGFLKKITRNQSTLGQQV